MADKDVKKSLCTHALQFGPVHLGQPMGLPEEIATISPVQRRVWPLAIEIDERSAMVPDHMRRTVTAA